MRQKLDAFQNSRAGHFLKKVMDDRAPNLAVLLAWGTLNTADTQHAPSSRPRTKPSSLPSGMHS
jgi:hypothetical protein